MKVVSVIGLGYIGLPTAVFAANAGYTVQGCDINERVVSSVEQGNLHLVEPGLDTLLKNAVDSGNLTASINLKMADVYLICVPTPFKGLEKDPDLSAVFSAVESICRFLKAGDLIILESTCPVGTTESVHDYLVGKGHKKGTFNVVYCPERVLPGNVIEEFQSNPRLVGEVNNDGFALAENFYSIFTSCTLHKTDSQTAELCKLAENSFRDINIAFANELSMICNDKIDVNNLIKLANLHPRVNILNPGPGVGGHCISVDPWFIVSGFPEHSKLIKMARTVNDAKPQWVIAKILSSVDRLTTSSGKAPRVVVYGLTFKPNIDDLRESPALQIARELQKSCSDVSFVEPNVENLESFNLIDLEEGVSKGDLHVMLVAHTEFKSEIVRSKMSPKIVLDFCGCFT